MRRRASAPVVLLRFGALLCVLLLAGCFASDETRSASDELADAYGDTPGTSQVRTESGLDGQNQEYVETVVILTADATVDQVVEVIMGHRAKVEDAGLTGFDSSYLRFRYAEDGPSLTMDWKGDADESAVQAGVEHWVLVEELVGPGVQLVLGSDGSELYGVAGETASDVGDIFRTLAADPVMSGAEAVWDVTADDGLTDARLAIDVLPTDAQLTAWDGLVSSLGKLPVDHAAVGLDVAISERATVQVDLAAPPGTTEADFDVDEKGDLMWPALHEQLDAVPTLHPDWGYFVDWAPTDSPTTSTALVSLLSDAPPIDNGDTTFRWSQAAYEYVEGNKLSAP